MDKEVFFSKLKQELDLEEDKINENSSLHLTSLMQLSLISFLDEHFNIRVKATEVKEIDSVKKLMDFIGNNKFK